MFADYREDDGSDEWIEENDTSAAEFNHQMNLERERQEDDWQEILDNDPGYHAWADDLDRLAEEDRDINELAAIENERKFNVLTAWD